MCASWLSLSWWRAFRSSRKPRGGRGRCAATRSQARWRLQTLEDRAVPATYTVDSALDVVNPIDNLFTLREAILAANASAGADSIEFATSLNGATITLN